MAVEMLQLPEDPDYLRDSVQNCVAKKLSLGLSQCNPVEISVYSTDFTNIWLN